jgi:hypothetical protein
MSTQTAPPPPQGGFGQTVLPPAFQQVATSAVGVARSPLEIANDNALRQGGSPTAPADLPTSHLDSNALDAARNADRAKAQAKVGQTATPAAPPTEPATPAEPSEQPTLDWKPQDKRKAAQWDQMKQSYEQQIAALKAQMEGHPLPDASKSATPAADPQPPADLTKFDISKHPEFSKLKEQHDTYYDIVKSLAAERDPEFQAKFDTERNAALKQLKFAAGGAADKLEKIMSLPAGDFRDAAIEDAIKDFTTSGKARFTAALTELSRVETARNIELERRKATFETSQQQALLAQSQQSQQRQAKIQQAFEQNLQRWQDPEEGHPFFQQREGDPKWNQQVQRAVQTARDIFTGKLDENQLSQASLWAAAGPMAVQGWQEAQARIAALEARLQEFRISMPGDSAMASQPAAQAANLPSITGSPTSVVDRNYVDYFAQNIERARQADLSKKKW